MTQSVEFGEVIRVFHDEDAARELVEKMRWRDGVRCPHCEGTHAYRLTPKEGSSTRKGLWKCGGCREQFTVTTGTIFHGTRIPLGKWLMAIHLICGSKKGISTLALARHLWGDNNKDKQHYKTAWFMTHRIREALTQEPMFGKLNKIVEVDETFVGGKSKDMHAKVRKEKVTGSGSRSHQAPVVTLVERGGNVRTRHVEHVTSENLGRILKESVVKTAHLMTDENKAYKEIGGRYAGHDAVNHSADEYVREANNNLIHVNTCESVHALLKRGVMGTYHHWSKKHLHRYLAEFDFRWNHRTNTDGEMTAEAIANVAGKRLTYGQPLGKKK